MRLIHQLRRRGVLHLAAAAAVAIPVVVAAVPAAAAAVPRFVSVPLEQARQNTRPGQIIPGRGGSYKIVAPAAPGCVRLDADSDTVGRNGGKVQTFGCNGSHNQNWAFDETDVPGLYRIRTGANGKCLDEDNRSGGASLSRLQM